MQNEYIAKTYPIREDIQSHTDKLIQNYDLLKRQYPKLEIDWELLKLACLYHDLGKMNQKFQDKVKGKAVQGEIPHGFLSIGFLDIKNLGTLYSREKIKILVNAIAFHHERNFEFSEYDYLVKEEINLLKNEVVNFKYDKLPDLNVFGLPSARYINGSKVTEDDGEDVFYQYILIKGLLNRIDYASSAHEKVERQNDFLLDYLDKMLQDWKQKKPNANWNNLQEYMIEHQDENVIAVAQTGMGKTEAGLLWIGNNKGFFTLPLKTAINSIYDRIRNDIVQDKIEERLGLLHSDAFSEYIKREESEEHKLELEEVGLSQYHERTKQLTMPLTVSTIDQLFDFVYRYKGFEPKPATLAYSKIVIDEIQMYSSDLIAYLISGLKLITKLGGQFAILTATFPPFIEDLLKKQEIKFIKPDPFINTNKEETRHSIKVKNEIINSDFILKHYEKNKVLVICNTVKQAQKLYAEITEKTECNVNLFHSSFIKRDRSKKESAILKIGNKNSEGYGIWICTQVVEASLDIDFDILITELSDLNGLFQRMGRCYRSRKFDFKTGQYNCYVFDGGPKKCTGVGYVIDNQVFELSKTALKNIEGIITEQEKLDLINATYTTVMLKETKYYKEVLDTLRYINNLYTNEMSKSDAKNYFRNINSLTIIPSKVYEKNEDTIKKHIKTINISGKGLQKEEREKLKIVKSKARSSIMNYTVSVPYYLTNNKMLEYLQISKYERLVLFSCNYNSDIGITPNQDIVKEKEKPEWDNFF